MPQDLNARATPARLPASDRLRLQVGTLLGDAAAVVSRALGKGWVRMDAKAGAMLAYELKTTATTTVKDRASGKTSVRELKSVMKCSWVKD